MKRLRFECVNLSAIALTAWISHYLHFTAFGLYGDDWYFQARPFVTGTKAWFAELWYFFRHPILLDGRPLQAIFAYIFAEAGATAHSLAVDYVVAYILFSASACMMYAVLRHRYSPSFSTLACLIFVLTPLHTLHQFLNGQFIIGPAFCLIFGAMLLYFRGRHVWSCALAYLTLTAYESIFFVFIGAPLLLCGNQFRNRRRVWIEHLGRATLTLCLYLSVRKFLFPDPRITGLIQPVDLIREVLQWWARLTSTSFLTYAYAAFRAWEAPLEAYCWLVPFLCLLGVLYKRNSSTNESLPDNSSLLCSAASECLTGFIFVVLGFTAAYFVFRAPVSGYAPVFYVDIATRVAMPSSVGSSIIVAGLLAAAMRMARHRVPRLAAYGVVLVALSVLFLYSFVGQLSYEQAWAEERNLVRQMVELTPDARSDSLIILQLSASGGGGFFDRQTKFIGGEATMYEAVFHQVVENNLPLPRMMIFYSSEWRNHLKRIPKGSITWSTPYFDGRWWKAEGEFKPGRLIVLEQWRPGWLVRRVDPVLVEGEQVVQIPPCPSGGSSIWALLNPNLLPGFLPPSTGRPAVTSATQEHEVELGSSFVIGASPVTIHWDAVPGAEDYWIDVGTEPAKGNIYAGFSHKATSLNVDLGPYLNGSLIHVQLYTKFKGIALLPGTGTKYVLATVRPTQ